MNGTPAGPSRLGTPARYARARMPTGARPAAPSDGGLARKAALWGGALVVAAVAVAGGINAMRHTRGTGTAATTRTPTRDHATLVGGRPALFWSERVSQIDKALAVARAAERTEDVARLTALREDTLRKAAALGLPEVASLGTGKTTP